MPAMMNAEVAEVSRAELDGVGSLWRAVTVLSAALQLAMTF
jgi:hypothetical protein